jgi:hypothetical protein
MPQTAHPLSAEDLHVHGTYDLRRALDLLLKQRAAGQDPPAGEHVNADPIAAGSAQRDHASRTTGPRR